MPAASTDTTSPVAEKIAALVGDGAATQALLAAIVADWRAAGARIAGVLAETHGLPDRVCGAGFLRDVGSGTPYRIYTDAPESRASCHLDAAGVASACAAVLGQIPQSDLVVLNKFGKLEAMGQGLAPAFAAAVAARKPLLTTISENHVEAWRAFASGAVVLAADKAALQTWWLGAKRRELR